MTDPLDPRPLEYRRKGAAKPPPRERLVGSFLLGLAGGAAVSVLVWGAGWDRFVGHAQNPYMLLVVPVVKGLIGVLLSRDQRWRGLAAGLLTSIPLGILIFGWGFLSHCRIG